MHAKDHLKTKKKAHYEADSYEQKASLFPSKTNSTQRRKRQQPSDQTTCIINTS